MIIRLMLCKVIPSPPEPHTGCPKNIANYKTKSIILHFFFFKSFQQKKFNLNSFCCTTFWWHLVKAREFCLDETASLHYFNNYLLFFKKYFLFNFVFFVHPPPEILLDMFLSVRKLDQALGEAAKKSSFF